MYTKENIKKLLVLALLNLMLFLPVIAKQHNRLKGTTLRVMTFNLWHGGDGIKLPKDTTIKYQLEAIRKAKADIVGFEEQRANQSDNASRAQLLADSLGWNCYIIDGSRALIAHYPMKSISKTDGAQAVLLQISAEKEVLVGVMHLMYTPYEPYDIADKKLTTAKQAEFSARKSRAHQVASILNGIKPAIEKGIPTILVGDFNEPSCLDWNQKAIEERADPLLPFPVNWPASALLIENGFKDAYRTVYPNVKSKPGYTWTSKPGLWREPDILDRIDFVFHSNGLTAKQAWLIGEEAADTDIQIKKWPSDHRAVVIAFELL